MEEGRKFPRLDLERDVLASGDAEDHAPPDEQHRQRGDECGHFKDGDQEAIDQPDRKPHDEAPDDSRPYPHIEIGRSEDHPEDRGCEAEGRADRKVQLLVDDDESHADREHAVARGVAQDGKERIGRTEEGRIEIEAGGVEDSHDSEEADLPAAKDERSLAAGVADPAVVGDGGHEARRVERRRGEAEAVRARRRSREVKRGLPSQPRPPPFGRRSAGFEHRILRSREAPGRAKALPRRSRSRRSVLEALADFVDVVLGHELGAGVQIRGRDVAVKLQIELHDRIEALQERLLSERALQARRS